MQLFPKTTDFFALFDEQATKLQKAVKVFHDLEEDGDTKKHTIRIKKIEHEADEITHEIINKLNTTFITPIDREDIAALSGHLDDIIDVMDMAICRLKIYKIDPIPKTVFRYLHMSEKAIKEVIHGIKELRNGKNHSQLLKHCEFVNFIENETDEMHRHTLEELFDNEGDPIYILKMREIYETLEHITDRCEDAANAMETIAVKNQ